MNNKAILIAAAILVSLSGCASTVTLNEYKAPANNNDVAIIKGGTTALTVVDSRVDPAIGHQKNGFGFEIADIRSDRPVASIVKSAIDSEFERRGVKVKDGKDVIVRITNFTTEFENGLLENYVSGHVTLVVSIGSFSKTIDVKNKSTVVFKTDAGVKAALAEAMDKAMNEMFNNSAFIAMMVSENG